MFSILRSLWSLLQPLNSVTVAWEQTEPISKEQDIAVSNTALQKHKSGFLTYHIEFKEVRERVLRHLLQNSIPINPSCDLFYDDAEYIGFWDNRYVYRLYNEDYLEPNLWPCKYLLIDANGIEEYEDTDYIFANKELPFLWKISRRDSFCGWFCISIKNFQYIETGCIYEANYTQHFQEYHSQNSILAQL